MIDFFPPQLEDFSHSFVDDTYNLLSSTDDTGIERHEADENQLSHPSPSNWEWAFFLLLEDACQTSAPSVAATRLPVLVSHDDAIYLLKLDAVNLRRDEKTLAELRERLFILWGNLAEVKSDFSTKLTSREFETCIQEYSVRGPNGWQRLHRLFQITITE